MSKLLEAQQSLLSSVVAKTPCQLLTPGSHPEIYQSAYRLRLNGALREDFPVTLSLLPTATQEDYLERFAATLNSQTFTLNFLGQYWLDFLQREMPNPDPAWMALAQWEWELVLAVYRDSAPEREAREYHFSSEGEGESGGTVEFAPALRVVASPYPLDKMYEEECLLPEEQSFFALWRKNGKGNFLRLEPVALTLLQKLLAGKEWHQIEAELAKEFAESKSLEQEVKTALFDLSHAELLRLRA